MTYHDDFDPELHIAYDDIPPAAQRYMAVWITLAVVILPIVVWAVL